MNCVVVKLLKQHLHFNNLKVFTYLYSQEKCTLSIYPAPSKNSRKYSLDLISQQVSIMKQELY